MVPRTSSAYGAPRSAPWLTHHQDPAVSSSPARRPRRPVAGRPAWTQRPSASLSSPGDICARRSQHRLIGAFRAARSVPTGSIDTAPNTTEAEGPAMITNKASRARPVSTRPRDIRRHRAAQSADGRAKYVYTFENFFHPFDRRSSSKAERRDRRPDRRAVATPRSSPARGQHCFDNQYTRTQQMWSGYTTFQRTAIDLDHQLPYANYNWELLYHIPVAVAVHLSQQPAIRRGAEVVPLRLRPDLEGSATSSRRAVLEVPVLPTQPPQTLDSARLLLLLSTPDSSSSDRRPEAQRPTSLTGYDASCSQALPAASLSPARGRSRSSTTSS